MPDRDLYRAALRICAEGPTEARARELLTALVDLSGAQRAYLELFVDASASARVRLSLSHGCTPGDEEEIRAVTSRGVVAAALTTGEVIHTPFALLDPRFSGSRSVREQRLEAVLCLPLQGSDPGVVYLEGKRGAGPFPQPVVETITDVVRWVGPAAARLSVLAPPAAEDPTAPHRQKLQLSGLFGRSRALASVFGQLALAAPLDVSVLITGPSGTGKTQLAQALHENSPRRTGPLVELNCAAIPEGLIESELFGTMPGAFPGARRSEGKVLAAHGGTLFLDEIAEIPLTAQGKLLQLLQSHQFYPLASSRPVEANFRLIAATNADLEGLVQQKRFREDLYYRLNVLAIRMPPLSERREDIAPLCCGLLERLASDHNLPKLAPSPSLISTLESMDWPGNVRQLRHALEAALIRAAGEGGMQLEPRHLMPGEVEQVEDERSFHAMTRRFHRDLLRRELESADWNVSEVARKLELTRSHVYNLIKSLQIQHERSKT